MPGTRVRHWIHFIGSPGMVTLYPAVQLCIEEDDFCSDVSPFYNKSSNFLLKTTKKYICFQLTFSHPPGNTL